MMIYVWAFVVALIITYALTPVVRHFAIRIGASCNIECQDRLAPMCCGIRLNAAAAAPRPGTLHKPACRDPRQASCLFGSDWWGYAARIPIETYPV